jgi:hypothetical protein
MFNLEALCGVETNFVDQSRLQELVEVFKTFEPTTIPEGKAHGVDYKHPSYDWFMDSVFCKLKEYTTRSDLKLIFAMYADVTESFKIHRDIKPIPEPDPPNKHFASFLIPVSVDYSSDKCKHNSTLVFENALLLEPEFNQPWHKIVPTMLSPYYKLYKQIQWNSGDIIWWNSIVPHAGANLSSLGLLSKQMIVVHTYV